MTDTIAGVTVILCSRNGAGTLPEALDALSRLDGRDTARFVLVNNASTDQTENLMKKWASDQNALVLREDRKGKSYALNSALDHVASEFVAFLDDDIVVSAGWLDAYLAAARQNPQRDVFTGQIRLRLTAEAPNWFVDLEREGKVLGATPLDRADGDVLAFQTAKGGNMFVRADAIGQLRFDEGRLNYGASGAGGEDTAFARAVARSDRGIVYIAGARAEHLIGAKQIGFLPYVQRQLRIARGQARRDGIDRAELGPYRLGVPLGGLRAAMRHAKLVAQHYRAGRNKEWQKELRKLLKIWAAIGEARRKPGS